MELEKAPKEIRQAIREKRFPLPPLPSRAPAATA